MTADYAAVGMERGMGMKKFLREFKEFAMRGNVLDMAVGVIIGGAFSKIVSSLVSDLIMPLLSIITGRINLSTLAWVITPPGAEGSPITVSYGVFLQTSLDFILIALCIFLAIKCINRFHKKDEKCKESEPVSQPTKEELLLTEIRDLLQDQQKEIIPDGKKEP